MFPNKQFACLFVVRMPLCLHVSLRVTRLLCSVCSVGCGGGGGEGTVTLGMFPRECEDTVARKWLLFGGGGEYQLYIVPEVPSFMERLPLFFFQKQYLPLHTLIVGVFFCPSVGISK